MAARPSVSVFPVGGSDKKHEVGMPSVFLSPVRADLINMTYTGMAKNARQPYAVNRYAGHQTSAESWGTGRAVSRIPRVSGGGTNRSGQGAFGNMCRKGRMFAPTKVWRRWHRHVNVNQKRYATVSALAASALPSLVMARGHKISQVDEIPLVLSDSAQGLKKTKDAVALCTKYGALADVEHAKDSRKVRAGKGKMRNRRYVQRRGPLVVYSEDNGIVKAFRNLPGVELAQVERLGLLQLAPGGHPGRFIIWTESAFKKLEQVYGTTTKKATLKAGYTLPNNLVTNSDLARLINSDEIQSVLKPAQQGGNKQPHKKNPLRNANVMARLNPAAKGQKRRALLLEEKRRKAKEAVATAKRAGTYKAPAASKEVKAAQKAQRKVGAAFYKKVTYMPEAAAQEEDDDIVDE